jgi:hypothetical protein
MTFLGSILVYLLLGVVLFAGIILMMKGSLWLLIVGLLGYAIVLAKAGCLPSGGH